MKQERSTGDLRSSRQRSPPVDKSLLSELASIRDRLNDLSNRVADSDEPEKSKHNFKQLHGEMSPVNQLENSNTKIDALATS